jgi:hypothetical protein
MHVLTAVITVYVFQLRPIGYTSGNDACAFAHAAPTELRHTLLYVCWLCVEQAIQADLATSQELVAASVAIYMFTAGLGALLWVRMSCYLQQGWC